ncbi:translation initiation factor IF-2-like [Triticum aestivum]|uniref:translation initiation factor IF-2-like n=1 Tax=Triticum aestivum TaxID=4565 RepID=UPI001D0150BF|nr:translation initiation factor IF-2-like [Triticum aestivum]
MDVEKVHFSMPLPAGLEGFPFTTFQAEQEAFIVKLRAEAKKAKAKAKVKEAKPEIKAKVEKAKPEIKAKEEKAKPEVKAKVEMKTLTTEEEEALIKFVALLEKEEDFLDAKKEAEKCGSKRKVELERDEEGAAFVAWIESTKPPTDQVEYSDGDVSDGYDSQDDAEANIGRVMSRYERHVRANNARWPFLIGGGPGGQIQSPEDADGMRS